jgi:hypothetical protein
MATIATLEYEYTEHGIASAGEPGNGQIKEGRFRRDKGICYT